MRIYVDIDGTLTKDPHRANGEPRLDNIEKIKELISMGHMVVVWSMTGTRYAKKFCRKHGINPYIAIGKPHVIVDDCSTIRPEGKMTHIDPDELLQWDGDKIW